MHTLINPLRLFIIGSDKHGQLWAKRYTWIASEGYASDYPLWAFPIETIGL